MLLNFGDWLFDVDIAATMEYSAREAAEHCDCAYCRNFYAAVDAAYPSLRPMLGSFGIDIEGPDELMPYDFPGEMEYEGVYAVAGKILRHGAEPIHAGNTQILADTENSMQINTGLTASCFFLRISVILPWVLKEPMEEVLSPANAPSFLKKMWDRIQGKPGNSSIKS